MTKRTLVIGGTGHTGRFIVQKLMQQGHGVRVLARNPHTARVQLDSQIEIIEGNITQATNVADAMQGVTGCVIIVESSESDSAPNSPKQVHYEGTRHVLAAAGPTTQIVLVTQIYITRPERFPEVRNVIHWRKQAEDAVRASGVSYTIIRPSWLTNDPGGREAIRFEQGDKGDGHISREDVAKACVQALLIPEAQGKTFEIYNEQGEPPQAWSSLFRQLIQDMQPE